MDSNEERCRSHGKQWLAAITMTLPMVTAGTLEILVKSNLHTLNLSDDVPAQLKQWAVLFTILGCVIGAIFGSVSADIFGRKKTLFTTAIGIIGGIVNIFSTSPTSCCIMLLIGGIQAGIACTVVPLYISEIADDKIRGRLLILQLPGIYTGQFIVMSIGDVAGWRVMNIVTIIIPIIFLIVTIWWFPETPYHLVSNKRYEAAEKSLAFFRGIGYPAAKEEVRVIINDVDKTSSSKRMSQKICELFRGKNRKGLIIIALLIIVQWNRMYLNVQEDLAYALQNVRKMPLGHALIIISATQLIWSGILVLTIDTVGRRIHLLGSTLGGLVMAGFAVVVIMDRSYIYFFTNLILHLCQIVTFGVSLVYVGELFPTNVKSIASATVVIFLTIFRSVILGIEWAVPDLIDYEFYIFIPLYLLAFVFILAFVPETKKKSFSDIQNVLADNGFKCRCNTKSKHNQLIARNNQNPAS